MSSFLDRVRQKPEAVRTRYFFFSVGISFLFIAVLWIFSLKTSLGSIMQDEATGDVLESVRNITKDAPDSLDALMKAGKTLTEQGNTSSEGVTAPENRIENLLPDSETGSEQTQESTEESTLPRENPILEVPEETTEENSSSKP